MDAYDKAVETALERDEDPEEYLRSKTEEKKREAEHIIAINQQQANAIAAVLCGLIPDYSSVKIKVTCDCPPIPWRHFDYSAIDDNSFDADWDGERYVTKCPIGHGATETEAIC